MPRKAGSRADVADPIAVMASAAARAVTSAGRARPIRIGVVGFEPTNLPAPNRALYQAELHPVPDKVYGRRRPASHLQDDDELPRPVNSLHPLELDVGGGGGAETSTIGRPSRADGASLSNSSGTVSTI